MTFEDYKRHFEIFSKIDTPAKLAICEKQYQDYLKRKDDADYFEPFEETSDNNSRLCSYEKNLHSILGFDKIANEQIFFLIQPSFEEEHLLIIEKAENSFNLTLITLEESYWVKFSNNSVSTVQTHVSSGCLNKSVGDEIFALVEQSIIDAKKPRSGYFALDGTVYKLSKIIDGIRRNVTKHSPEENSKTGRVIELLNTIVELAEGNSSPNIKNEIESKVKLINTQQDFKPDTM